MYREQTVELGQQPAGRRRGLTLSAPKPMFSRSVNQRNQPTRSPITEEQVPRAEPKEKGREMHNLAPDGLLRTSTRPSTAVANNEESLQMPTIQQQSTEQQAIAGKGPQQCLVIVSELTVPGFATPKKQLSLSCQISPTSKQENSNTSKADQPFPFEKLQFHKARAAPIALNRPKSAPKPDRSCSEASKTQNTINRSIHSISTSRIRMAHTAKPDDSNQSSHVRNNCNSRIMVDAPTKSKILLDSGGQPPHQGKPFKPWMDISTHSSYLYLKKELQRSIARQQELYDTFGQH